MVKVIMKDAIISDLVRKKLIKNSNWSWKFLRNWIKEKLLKSLKLNENNRTRSWEVLKILQSLNTLKWSQTRQKASVFLGIWLKFICKHLTFNTFANSSDDSLTSNLFMKDLGEAINIRLYASISKLPSHSEFMSHLTVIAILPEDGNGFGGMSSKILEGIIAKSRNHNWWCKFTVVELVTGPLSTSRQGDGLQIEFNSGSLYFVKILILILHW